MKPTKPLTIALSKGYLMTETLRQFETIGIHFDEDLEKSRKLFALDRTKRFKILKIRPWDVPEYIKEGAADIGIAGQDVLLEKDSPVLKLLDLKFGVCKLVLAGPTRAKKRGLQQNMTIATKYPNATEAYFKQKGINIKLIKLYGAIELAPLTGLSDIICDLTATGRTLKEHNLHILDTVFTSTAVLIANPTSFKVHYDAIQTLANGLK